jgi:hypothetical protein
MVPCVVLVFASHTDRSFGAPESSRLCTTWHRRSWDRSGDKLVGIFVYETQFTISIAFEATFVHGDTDVSCIPWDIGVTISNTAELTGLVDLLASLAYR